MVAELGCDGTYQLSHLEAALAHVKKFRTAIDLGAHVGTWSKVMAGRFQRVIAVEPSPDTFEALTTNVRQFGLTNVECRNVAVGAAVGTVTMTLDALNEQRANTGARYTVPGGSIPVEMLDGWGITDLDFLKMDIEGSEPHALHGALETLRRWKPIVLFEDKRLWTRHFGLPKDTVARTLTSLGYHQIAKVSMDAIWGPLR